MTTLTYSPAAVYPAFDDIGDIREHIERHSHCAVFVEGICLNIGNVPVDRIRDIKESFN